MIVYQRLRDMREDADKTQQDIAKLLFTTQQQYARYESGERELPMHHFITLAKFYNISLDYLAGLTDTPRTLTGESYKISPKYNISQNGNITNNFT